ncbi:hypothetical protein NQ315_002719 [Exocentrus adspersus]|uniref:Reverse transcriptase domain-containing protein n=1 Tax=Exocentrus adspersus TaxID=1586481 RepID=A0AAV8VHZ3_9CUCU|nr:hypothetical protein NQ315_002719 [Exocentrus adspersus]
MFIESRLSPTSSPRHSAVSVLQSSISFLCAAGRRTQYVAPDSLMGKKSRKRRSSSESSKDDKKISNRVLVKRIDRLERELKKKRRLERSRSPVGAGSDAHRHRSRSRLSARRLAHIEDRLQRESASPSIDAERAWQGSPSVRSNFEDQSTRGLASIQSADEIPAVEQLPDADILVINNDEDLGDEIIKILGEDPQKSDSNKSEVHNALSTRWNHIIKVGITEETRDTLYKIPSNLELTPPEVNQEIVQVLTPIHKKRDAGYALFQTQVGHGIAALGQGLNTLLEDQENIPAEMRQKLLSPLWDAGRIFADLFYNFTQTRRILITPLLSKAVKEVAEKTTPEKFLFGDQFGDKIKSAKMLEKVGKELLPQTSSFKNAKVIRVGERGGGKRSLPSNQAGNRYRPTRPKRETKSFTGLPSRSERYYHHHNYKRTKEEPRQARIPREATYSQKELLLIKDAIKELLVIGAVELCQSVPNQFISSTFLADKPNVPVDPTNRRYLRFRWEGQLYEFTCIPFGLSTAPFTFTKMIKPITESLRVQGISCISYLDDFLILGKTETECLQNTRTTLNLLQSLGILINTEKSCLQPSRRQKFLGFIFDSHNMTLELPRDKELKIKKSLNIFLTKKSSKIRTFAKFIGVLLSACPAVKYGWFIEREKFKALTLSNMNYDAPMKLSSTILPDLLWWNNIIMNCKNDIKHDSFQMEIYTDSSLSGWGACTTTESTRGWWSEQDKKNHINFLELQAVLYGLECFAKTLQNCNVLVRTDNTTALACINRMGSVQHPYLHELARKIWQLCEARDLFVFASYINTKENWRADYESRSLSTDTEWSLASYAFSRIVETFGRPDIDLFASKISHKCMKYISWFRDPQSVAENTSNVQVLYPGSDNVIRQAFRLKGFPECAVDTALQSITQSTIKQYNVTYKLWWKFCQDRGYRIYEATAKEVIEFLHSLLQTQNGKYGTFNSHRSALSLILPENVGEDFRVKRFLKAIANVWKNMNLNIATDFVLSCTVPATPRYSFTWDIHPVLEHLEKMFPNEKLSLKDISFKLATLVTLITVIYL